MKPQPQLTQSQRPQSMGTVTELLVRYDLVQQFGKRVLIQQFHSQDYNQWKFMDLCIKIHFIKMLLAGKFKITLNWKPTQYHSAVEWVNILSYICSTKCYIVIKMKNYSSFQQGKRNLINLNLSKRSQTTYSFLCKNSI